MVGFFEGHFCNGNCEMCERINLGKIDLTKDIDKLEEIGALLKKNGKYILNGVCADWIKFDGNGANIEVMDSKIKRMDIFSDYNSKIKIKGKTYIDVLNHHVNNETAEREWPSYAVYDTEEVLKLNKEGNLPSTHIKGLFIPNNSSSVELERFKRTDSGSHVGGEIITLNGNTLLEKLITLGGPIAVAGIKGKGNHSVLELKTGAATNFHEEIENYKPKFNLNVHKWNPYVISLFDIHKGHLNLNSKLGINNSGLNINKVETIPTHKDEFFKINGRKASPGIYNIVDLSKIGVYRTDFDQLLNRKIEERLSKQSK